MDSQSVAPTVAPEMVSDAVDIPHFDIAVGDRSEEEPGPQASAPPPELHSPAPPGPAGPMAYVSDLDHMFEQAMSEFSVGSAHTSPPRPPEPENVIDNANTNPDSFIWKMNYVDALYHQDIPHMQNLIADLQKRMTLLETHHAEQPSARHGSGAIGSQGTVALP